MTDADFTRTAAKMVAENDRVPVQRVPTIKRGDRILVIREGAEQLLDVEDVKWAKDGSGFTMTTVPVAGE